MAGETLETKIRITGESSEAERAIVGTINEIDKLATDLKKPIGRIAAFEDATESLGRLQQELTDAQGKRDKFLSDTSTSKDASITAAVADATAKLNQFETELRDTTAKRDAFLNSVSARKDAIIGTSVAEANAKLGELENALTEAQRKRDFFMSSAEGAGAAGMKLFGKDIAASKDEVLNLARAVTEQKDVIAGLPKALDEKATKAATAGLAEYEKEVRKAGAAVQSQTAVIAKLPEAIGNKATKDAAVDLRAYETEVRKAGGAVDSQTAKLKSMEAGLEASGVDTKNLAAEKNRLATAVGNAERGSIRMKGALLEERNAAGQAADKTKEAGNAAQKAGEQSNTSAGGVDNLAGKLKVLAGAAVVKEFISANASIESIGKSLEAVTGSAESAGREMDFIRGEANRLGVETAEAAKSFLTLAAATKNTALEGQATRDIFSAVSGKMAELGASSADVSGAMVQLAQGVSKGKFEMDDLKSIAERIPGFFGIFAKALGVTTAEFFEMQSQGKITADLLPKLAAELGNTGARVDTFNASWARIKNTLKDTAVAVGEGTGLFDLITGSLNKTSDGVNFATLGFKAMAARVNGDKDKYDTLLQQLEATKNRLLGIEPAAKAAGDGIAGMANKAATAAADIEANIRDKIVGSLIKLDGSIKTTADAFKNLGIDPAEIQTGISAAERIIIESFKKLAADPNTNGIELTSALLASLGKVSKEAVPEIGFAYKTAAKDGRQSTDELAAGVEALKTKQQGLWDGMIDGSKKAAAETSALAEAYKTLGIISQAEMQKTADKNREAYQTLVESKAPLADLSAAWKKMAEASIAANDGVASSALKSEAAARGFGIEVDKAGKSSVKALGETSAAAKDVDKNISNAGNSAKSFNGSVLDSVSGMRAAATAASIWADELARAAGFASAAAQKVNEAKEANRNAGASTSWQDIFGANWALLSGDQQAIFAERYRKAQPDITSDISTGQLGSFGKSYKDSATFQAIAGQINLLTADKRAAALTVPASTAHTSHNVNITLNGRTTTINAASASDATSLTNLLKQLQADASRV